MMGEKEKKVDSIGGDDGGLEKQDVFLKDV